MTVSPKAQAITAGHTSSRLFTDNIYSPSDVKTTGGITEISDLILFILQPLNTDYLKGREFSTYIVTT